MMMILHWMTWLILVGLLGCDLLEHIASEKSYRLTVVYCSVTSREAVFSLHSCLTGDQQLFGHGPRRRVILFFISILLLMFSMLLSWALQRC